MNVDSETVVVTNDLDSMVHRIEALGAHPRFTDALNFVKEAKVAITEARSDLHQRAMKERFARANRA